MIDVDYKTHPELYRDHKKSLEFCRGIVPCRHREFNRFHAHWFGPPFGRMQALAVKGFLTSQQCDARLTVWTNREIRDDPHWQPFRHLRQVEYAVFDERIVLDTPFARWNAVNWQHTDIVRLIYLWNFGGVHIDMDTVLLRDLSPLLDQEFFYNWGSLPEEIAGGVIHLRKGGELCRKIIDTMIDHHNDPGVGLYRGLFARVRQTHPFAVFPCAWFNTEWAISDQEVAEAENPAEMRRHIDSAMHVTAYSNEMYDGAFAWHWHNQWHADAKGRIEPGSKWSIMEDRINRKFCEQFGDPR